MMSAKPSHEYEAEDEKMGKTMREGGGEILFCEESLEGQITTKQTKNGKQSKMCFFYLFKQPFLLSVYTGSTCHFSSLFFLIFLSLLYISPISLLQLGNKTSKGSLM